MSKLRNSLQIQAGQVKKTQYVERSAMIQNKLIHSSRKLK